MPYPLGGLSFRLHFTGQSQTKASPLDSDSLVWAWHGKILGFPLQELRGTGTCVRVRGKASVPSHNNYQDVSGTFTTKKGWWLPSAPRAFGMLFPSGVSCVYESCVEIEHLKS